MFKCSECDKEFSTLKSLNGHKGKHIRNPLLSFTCLNPNCNKEGFYKPSNRTGRFCSTACFFEHKWLLVDRKRVLEGNGDTHTIKKYLTETIGYKCNICGISEYMNMPLSLHLDHIDGNSDNNKIENVRLLCPNCHSQEETSNNNKIKKNTKRNCYQQQYKREYKQK